MPEGLTELAELRADLEVARAMLAGLTLALAKTPLRGDIEDAFAHAENIFTGGAIKHGPSVEPAYFRHCLVTLEAARKQALE